MEHLVIIGNGITGISTARHVRKKSDIKITIISSETRYFFSRTALMYIYMGHMKYNDTKPYEDWFWNKNNIDLIYAHITEIDTDGKTVKLDNDTTIPYSKLVIASGSKSNKFGWPGQDLGGVQGLYSYNDLLLLEKNSANIKKAVIVGGGLIGIELAEMLLTRKIDVTFLVREKYYWDNILPADEAKMISKHILEHGVDLRLQTQLHEIIPDETGRACAVITDKNEKIDCQFVGLTAGVHPNTDVAKNSKIKTNKGFLVNEYFETNIPDVYAAGDCAEIYFENESRYRIEQLWYTGRLHGETLAEILTGNRIKYERGIWFNSAKFFDIEYQTYGFVPNIPLEKDQYFYWQDEKNKVCIKIVYDKEDKNVSGVNVLGIRMRHNIWEKWIREKYSVDYIMKNLKEAVFDPEFYKHYENKISEAFFR